MKKMWKVFLADDYEITEGFVKFSIEDIGRFGPLSFRKR
jgi:hypothetical protein